MWSAPRTTRNQPRWVNLDVVTAPQSDEGPTPIGSLASSESASGSDSSFNGNTALSSESIVARRASIVDEEMRQHRSNEIGVGPSSGMSTSDGAIRVDESTTEGTEMVDESATKGVPSVVLLALGTKPTRFLSGLRH
uniref:Uncharacterized protein n=1 Tax=Solanum tuberosum TaxID=4113 RepID=M1DWA6_SOLTU